MGAQLAIVANVTISSIGVASIPGGAMETTTMLLHSLLEYPRQDLL